MTSNLQIVKLEKMTYGGDALGRLPDGRVVFVPFGLPSETTRVRIVNEKSGHARAELVEVLESSPERITPRCRHYGICGGCHYQHLHYQAQLISKTEILRDQLKRLGKVETSRIGPFSASPNEWNYRNHVQFHLSPEGKLGFLAAHTRSVVPISECYLPEPTLNDLWPRLDLGPGLGLERVSLRLGFERETMLVMESRSAELPQLDLESSISVVHLAGGDAVVMAGDDHLHMQVNDRMFQVSAASFFQVNSSMAGRMAAYLVDNLPVSEKTILLEVYCGVGLFSAFFAGRVGCLIGIEASPQACEDFTSNLDEFDNVELYEARAEDILPTLHLKPDLVILDPPRTGLQTRALDALLDLRPERIAYVSCDPSTLARDAARLIAGGYLIRQVVPFDLFPQTYHIESISIFEKS